jgi:hypothetical protein
MIGYIVRNATYQDFHVALISGKCGWRWTKWIFVWVDFVGKGGIRVGELPEPSKEKKDGDCVCDEVFAVSSTVITIT